MKSDLIYHEMSGQHRELHHIYDGLEYAHCIISIGVAGEINSDYTTDEIIQIQTDTCNYLEKAMEGIVHLIGAHSNLKEDKP